VVLRTYEYSRNVIDVDWRLVVKLALPEKVTVVYFFLAIARAIYKILQRNATSLLVRLLEE
jgi:hypothetical protein